MHRRLRSPMSSPTKSPSAMSRATICSLPTLQERPIPCWGRPRRFRPANSAGGGRHCSKKRSWSRFWSRAEATRSRRPHRMPLPCGPRIALPPLMETRSAPSSRKRQRFRVGGSWDAASTSTGTPFACATSATAAREGREIGCAT